MIIERSLSGGQETVHKRAFFLHSGWNFMIALYCEASACS